jgi:hypothetical protein
MPFVCSPVQRLRSVVANYLKDKLNGDHISKLMPEVIPNNKVILRKNLVNICTQDIVHAHHDAVMHKNYLQQKHQSLCAYFLTY